jgi:thioredoxin-like negative regulator of GroEL
MAAQGRTTEAEQMLDALLDRARNDGAVNLTMARLLASTHRARGATAFYHRAIYGQWGADSSSRRTAARFELIDLLVSQHARADLLAELLPLQTDSADSTTLLARVAPLYLKADAPGRAAEAFRALLRRSPSNAAAYVGLGDAALADGQFATARAAFRDAARVRAGDASIAARLRLADTLVALDPTARGLSDSQRLRRSRELLARTVRAVDACAPVVSSSGTTARDTALAQLGAASPRGGPALAAERALALATGIWRGRPDACLPDSNESFDVLVLLQRSLTR